MRVLCINDISCVGKCSLTVSLPIISACGVTCDVLPTAVLSTHTGGFTGYTLRDLTSDIPDIIKHWKSLDLKFDFIYSGYLSDQKQIDLVYLISKEFLKEGGKFIVDPVMGDNGKLYAGFNGNFVQQMRSLCSFADFILPNVTEACLLAGVPYEKFMQNKDGFALVKALSKICPRPIVTGVQREEAIGVHYIDGEGVAACYTTQNVDGFFHGSGDVFSSAFVGALAKGKAVDTAIMLAADFTTAAIKRTAKEVEDKRFGLNFEAEIFPFLKALED